MTVPASMVERVSAALNVKLRGFEEDVRIGELTESELADIARAAIAAMREPSDEMIQAVGLFRWGPDWCGKRDKADWDDTIELIQSGISAALQENET